MPAFLSPGKLRAFLIHLGISAGIVGVVAVLMLSVWYPQPWFMHDGGWTVFRLIMAVDVVLGPLLTLIVFQRGKHGLARDLTIIAALQLGALAFGVTTMIQHRPAFIVYGEQNFFAVTWHQVKQGSTDIDRLSQLRRSSPLRELKLVYLQLPADPEKRARLRREQNNDGPVIVSRGDYYRELTPKDWQEILSHGSSVAELARNDADIRAALEKFRQRHPEPLETFAFLPVVCRDDVVMLVFDRNTKALIGWLD